MRNLLVVGLLTSLLFSSLSHTGERERVRCQKTVSDEAAHDIFSTIMPGRPSEMVTVCGLYKDGNATWYFLRSLASKPDEVTKVYIHHVEPNTIQTGDGLLIRLAYSGEASSIKNMLVFTTKITTKKVVLSYVDEQDRLREKELSASDLETK